MTRRRLAQLPPIAKPWPAFVLGIDSGRTSGAALLAADGRVLWARQVRHANAVVQAVQDAHDAAVAEGAPLVPVLEHWNNHGPYGGSRTQRGLGKSQGRWRLALELRGVERRIVQVEPADWYRLVIGGRKRRDDKYTVVRAMKQRFDLRGELGPDAAEALAIAVWGRNAGALGMVLPARLVRAHLAHDPGLLDELERRRRLVRTTRRKETP